MSKTLSTRLAMAKPTPGTNEPVSLADYNIMVDKLDSAVGATPCASGTRPAGFAGQIIKESDTGRMYVRNTANTAWEQVMGPGQLLAAPTVGVATLRAQLSSGTAVGNRFLGLRGSADANDTYLVDYDGNMQWGPGSAGSDVNLYRSAANVLKTDDQFQAASVVINGGAHRLMTQFNDLQLAANYTMTATITDLPGMTWTFTTLRASALAVVTFHGDFTTTGGTVGTGNIRLAIDGVDLTSPQALYNAANTTLGGRVTTGNQAFITLSAAGSHTIKARAQQSGTLGMILQALHTTMNVQIFE